MFMTCYFLHCQPRSQIQIIQNFAEPKNFALGGNQAYDQPESLASSNPLSPTKKKFLQNPFSPKIFTELFCMDCNYCMLGCQTVTSQNIDACRNNIRASKLIFPKTTDFLVLKWISLLSIQISLLFYLN